ncbi:MAG: ABC transporter ATP-binding protein [Deltaproteobacteria bacterium]|nr:ABC transporter ATP-binding protein [Deltaproteobacteria bacterium]
MKQIILETNNLTKTFGALMAVNNFSIEFTKGIVHAIIGPNGAGKTTLLNLLAGELAPTSGSISFKYRDITHAQPDTISQLGLGRSYQKTNIFPQFTCYQNCWIGAQSRLNTSMRFFRPAAKLIDVKERTEKALEMVNLSHQSGTIASPISYGEQRQLEIATMLATEPELLLLDEPLAGMGAEEAQNVIELLLELAKNQTLILIEHDMDAVFAVADRLTVMVNGSELETGTVDEIRNSQAVQEAYLGEEGF